MTPTIPGLPSVAWVDSVGKASATPNGLTMSAPGTTDWFSDPGAATQQRSAPALTFPVAGSGQLRACVSVGFGATFDAGVLFVHQGPDDYAKLCFEQSPTGEATVVSVVTRGVSDDANGPVVEGDEVWLRVCFSGDAIAFHHSLDGRRWDLTRLFAMRSPTAATTVGFLVQSPTGHGCTATFSDVGWSDVVPGDLRDGS